MAQPTGIKILPGAGEAGNRAIKTTANALVENVPLLGDVKNASEAGVKVLQYLTSPGLWKRVGVGVVGFYLVYWGILLFLSGTPAGKKAIGTSVSAAKLAATKGAVS